MSGLAIGACASVPAYAQQLDQTPPAPGLGLAPGTPQVGTLPGGLTPAYGQSPTEEGQWQFDFHGLMTMPLRAGLNKRSGPVTTDQHQDVLHAPPVVPDYSDAFTYTTVVPEPYAQLNFSYGNNIVTGTAILLAQTASTAQTFFNPPAEAGIADAFLTFRLPNLVPKSHFEANVGIFSNRYGAMGEYDLGRYGTPAIAQINGAGENIFAQFALGKFLVHVEQGIAGQIDSVPEGLLPAGWNGFASPTTGSGFANHVHLGLGWDNWATLGLHYLSAFTQDDRAEQGNTPDGTINVLGADLRLSMNHFGHLYLAGAHTDAKFAGSIGSVIQVLNTQGGQGLMTNYFGPNSNGTGNLTTFAAQYDLSIGKLIRYPHLFKGNSPDIVLSLFGMMTHVGSNDKVYDNVTKMKFGGEAAYALLPWLAVSLRFDQVQPDSNGGGQTPGCSAGASCNFSIVSPRIILRSKWQARDQVVLQYSHWMYGSGVQIRNGFPATYDPTIHPDQDMISLSASMWW
jgi:hypothetical protein